MRAWSLSRCASAVLATLALVGSPAAQTDTPRLAVEPDHVEVGEPFTLALVVPDRAALDVGAPDVDASWVVLDEGVEPLDGGVRFHWTLASLEAGDRLVGLVPGEDVAGVPAPVRVRVAGVLGPDETEPRPLRGLPADFGAVPPVETSWPAWAWGLAGLALGLGLAGLWWWLRRRGPAPAAAPTLRERLAALAAADVDVVARHHGWVALLRAAVDARTGRPRAGLLEEEWLAAVAAEPRVPADLHARLARVLGDTRVVRFGGERPSAFALEATEREVRALLDALEAGAVPAGRRTGGRAA